MSVLDALDATRICARGSSRLNDPAAWARPVPVAARAAVAPVPFSWRGLVRNPNALLMTGMIGTVMIKDALTGVLAR